MNFDDATIQSYLLISTSVIAIVFLLSLILDYWLSATGLRKGSILLAFIAIILVALPSAENLVLKFGEGEFSYDRSGTAGAKQAVVTDTSKLIKKQNDDISIKLENISKILEINGKVVAKIAKQNSNNKSLNEELQKLLKKQADITNEIKVVRPSYEVVFDNLLINEICEVANDTGEFYYTFMINGDSVINVPFDKSIKKRKGEHIKFSDSKKVIKTLLSDDTFNFYGVVNESDGRTMFRNKIKFTPVGEATKEYLFSERSGKETLVVFGDSSTICKATLTFKVNEITNNPANN